MPLPLNFEKTRKEAAKQQAENAALKAIDRDLQARGTEIYLAAVEGMSKPITEAAITAEMAKKGTGAGIVLRELAEVAA